MLLIPIIDILQGQSGRGPWPLAHNPQLLGAEHTLLVPHGVLQIAVRSERVYIYIYIYNVFKYIYIYIFIRVKHSSLFHLLTHVWLLGAKCCTTNC